MEKCKVVVLYFILFACFVFHSVSKYDLMIYP